ncbi:hypothetical protein FOZ61_006819 [Perkinsus olseni]|uniref:Immunoglobulin super DCC subclass member n=1 Tax=Perkinsus olseni TaxID=32597 RepID=A0A7J6MWX7_PEROL|nr:hypothetical protein FOZ61_006819 [Perkinsus olseni]KAF4676063.1 hypothetical protein FOL46_007941 [Perkinsus olseni]
MRFIVSILAIAAVAAEDACSNDDLGLMGGDVFSEFVWYCTQTAFIQDSYISECLETGCNMTRGCASCFDDYGRCARGCLNECFVTPSGDSCATCMTKLGCTETLYTCTGLTEPLPSPTKLSPVCSATGPSLLRRTSA